MRISPLILISLLMSYVAKAASVVIENYTDRDIHYLYLSPGDSRDWGPDRE